jgi:hypothetical protein
MLLCSGVYMTGCADSPETANRSITRLSDAQQSNHVIDLGVPAKSADVETIAPAVIVDRPTFDRPVTAAMALSPLLAGEAAQAKVWIKISIAAGHYIYGRVDEHSPFQSLTIDSRLPEGAEFDGDWIYPEPRLINGQAVYYDSVLVHRRVQFATEPNGPIEAVVHYQVCNEDICFPPAKIQLFEDKSP